MMKAILKLIGRQERDDVTGKERELQSLRHRLRTESIGLSRINKIALRSALIDEMVKRDSTRNDHH